MADLNPDNLKFNIYIKFYIQNTLYIVMKRVRERERERGGDGGRERVRI